MLVNTFSLFFKAKLLYMTFRTKTFTKCSSLWKKVSSLWYTQYYCIWRLEIEHLKNLPVFFWWKYLQLIVNLRMCTVKTIYVSNELCSFTIEIILPFGIYLIIIRPNYIQDVCCKFVIPWVNFELGLDKGFSL